MSVTAGAAPRDAREPHPVPLIFRVITVITFAYLLIPAGIVVAAGLNSGNYLTFPPDTPDTQVAPWQKALDSMKQDGSFARLTRRWLHR